MNLRKKKWAASVFLLLILSVFSVAFITKDRAIRPEAGEPMFQAQEVFITGTDEVRPLDRWMQKEISAGNLKLASVQTEDLGGYVHQRYDIYHYGIRVWGAQLIRHLKDGRVYCINGSFEGSIDCPTVPTLNKAQALDLARSILLHPEYDLVEEPELVVFPGPTGHVLAYMVGLADFDEHLITFINALTGDIVFRYNNVHFQAAIGIGKGTHNDSKKLSTELKSAKYWKIDIMRPARLITGHMNYTMNYMTTYYMTDDDNNWPDKVSVDAHAYLGWVYDYFNLVHGRKGMNNANMENVINIHVGVNYENAFYHPATKWIYFGDGNPAKNYPYAAALDIVAHEFAHGVTDHSSRLIYAFEPGALNEAFSDIMGVSCEFFHQPAGYGYLKADWWEGEDIEKVFKAGRDLSDPSRIPIWEGYAYYYPDHYTKRYILPMEVDNGGVHINMTIPSHWFYLLANGGTNKTSGHSVQGIGLSPAEKIAYRAWVFYLTPSAVFGSARSATYQAAVDLYGSASTQALRVAQAWNAVGVF